MLHKMGLDANNMAIHGRQHGHILLTSIGVGVCKEIFI